MRKFLRPALALLVVVCGVDARPYACGDKFLLIGRALKYQKAYASAHPGSILIYDNPGSRVGSVARELQLQQILAGAGHKVQVVTTLPALEEAMRTSAPDLILMDGNDIVQLEHSLQRGTAQLLSIGLLQAPGKSRHPLSVIDDALKLKPKSSKS